MSQIIVYFYYHYNTMHTGSSEFSLSQDAIVIVAAILTQIAIKPCTDTHTQTLTRKLVRL